MKTAVITGASSGLGAEFVRCCALSGDYEETIAIARRADRLNALKEQFPCVFPLALDITAADAAYRLSECLSERAANVTLFINCAGMGKCGSVSETPLQCAAIDLNCRALTALTVATLPFMDRGAGIINIASIAAFMPTPNLTVYAASKAYVLSFSKGLKRELEPRGIKVLAVCPGPIRTEFLPLSGLDGSKPFARLTHTDPQYIAPRSLRALKKGKWVYTPRLVFKLLRVACKLLPDRFIIKFSGV